MSDTRRCRRSCGENAGTADAVQARVIAVRIRSPLMPSNHLAVSVAVVAGKELEHGRVEH
jgi:hypothetical protein